MQHLILYDGECGVCDGAVQWVLRHDKDAIFAFAPLQGTTAATFRATMDAEMRSVDSIVLVENFRLHPTVNIRGKAVFRICWLLGGRWCLLGWLSFLPSWLYDWGYTWVAARRYQLAPQRCLLPTATQRQRFLP